MYRLIFFKLYVFPASFMPFICVACACAAVSLVVLGLPSPLSSCWWFPGGLWCVSGQCTIRGISLGLTAQRIWQCQWAKRMLETGLGSYSGRPCHLLNGPRFLMLALFILAMVKTFKRTMERREKKALIEWYTVIFVWGACSGGLSVCVCVCVCMCVCVCVCVCVSECERGRERESEQEMLQTNGPVWVGHKPFFIQNM